VTSHTDMAEMQSLSFGAAAVVARKCWYGAVRSDCIGCDLCPPLPEYQWRGVGGMY
jgi:hypothetical protein